MFFHNCPCLNVLSGMNLTSFCSPLELFSVKMLNYHELKSGVRRILKEKQWLKTVVFVQGCDCCAALPQAIDKTSSCFFHVGQILHQHFRHEFSNFLIHSFKASQFRDDVLKNVFPDIAQQSQQEHAGHSLGAKTNIITNRSTINTLITLLRLIPAVYDNTLWWTLTIINMKHLFSEIFSDGMRNHHMYQFLGHLLGLILTATNTLMKMVTHKHNPVFGNLSWYSNLTLACLDVAWHRVSQICWHSSGSDIHCFFSVVHRHQTLGQNLHASIPPTWIWLFVRQIHVIAFYLLISINFQVSSLFFKVLMTVMRVNQHKTVGFAISCNHLRLEVSPCHRCF